MDIGSGSGRRAISAISIALAVAAAAGIAFFAAPRHAQALPSYARQTGQQCAACHNGFPELTPYGRLFKLNGYVFGGGSSDLPPIAVMNFDSFTHTQTGQPGGAAPHFGQNNNFATDQTSLFYGGAIASNLGAFAQVTYDGIGRAFSWDNTDIRYARTANIAGAETVLGLSLNNNPTVQDVWNTTPAWSFPFVSSKLAPTPLAATMIEGGFAQQVAGLTTYAYWDRLVYLEAGVYRTLSPGVQRAFGAFSSANNGINGVAPYWRAAVQRDWYRNSLEAGLFGMAASVKPQRLGGFGADHLTDVGIDAQYQFLTDRNSFSLQASAIFENQNLSASGNPTLGLASNTHNTLRSLHAKASYYYDQTYGVTLGAFRLDGSADPTLYPDSPSGKPNSTGIIGELDYIPFNHGGPSFWPWLNLKLGVQYIYYPQFDGQVGSAATKNNTLYAFVWFAF
ncbi:hypothetical protein GCM10011611_36080 [Aliidongia dinghuensis]|uniref:Cytochrome C n=1 Tax=Aliidongia dinghuensis TaxID=1867774 RepID=A0A8J2YV89_9PROT|nr:cytochrome C [Aliidongia dinghuensis]GGF26840.1 hypothetical protein GCM10011611_36080 [Aliidongia dinghuensis]